MLSPEDVELLEKKRIKYKIKRFFKFFIPFVILISFIGVYYFIPKLKWLKDESLKINYSFLNFLNNTGDNNLSNKESLVDANKEIKKEYESVIPNKTNVENIINPINTDEINKNSSNKIINANAIPSTDEKNNTLKLHTAFLENLDTKNIQTIKVKESLPLEELPKEPRKSYIKIDSKEVREKPKPKLARKKIVEDIPENIDISFEGKNIDYLEKMFKKTNDFKYSIALAEEYYIKKDYQKSIKWSMISNDINEKDERSWIYFSKSKVKLGEKTEAIEALKLFLKKNQSRGADKLLSRIENDAL